MGNCLKRSTADDISLLRESESGSNGGRMDLSDQQPAPIYSVNGLLNTFMKVNYTFETLF